ncbi:MAG TPA: hypothetical protein VIG69_15465, partial [Candidatus Methylomirabilis sp.]
MLLKRSVRRGQKHHGPVILTGPTVFQDQRLSSTAAQLPGPWGAPIRPSMARVGATPRRGDYFRTTGVWERMVMATTRAAETSAIMVGR